MPKYRNICHYLAGIVSAVGVDIHWCMVLGSIFLFIAYEVNEDWHLNDKAFHDILEFMIGFFVALTGIIIWRFICG